MMQLHSPAHPGELLKSEVLGLLGLTVTSAAQVLGVGRPALSGVLNGRTGMSPEMAIRVEKAFGVSMELLLKMQLQYDIARARKAAARLKVVRYKPAA